MRVGDDITTLVKPGSRQEGGVGAAASRVDVNVDGLNGVIGEFELCLGTAGSSRGDSYIVDSFDAEPREFGFCGGADRTRKTREKGLGARENGGVGFGV